MIDYVCNTQYSDNIMPDMAFAMAILTRLMSYPNEVHFKGCDTCTTVLRGTTDDRMSTAMICVTCKEPPVGYPDSIYGNDHLDSDSYAGYMFSACGFSVSWKYRNTKHQRLLQSLQRKLSPSIDGIIDKYQVL